MTEKEEYKPELLWCLGKYTLEECEPKYTKIGEWVPIDPNDPDSWMEYKETVIRIK